MGMGVTRIKLTCSDNQVDDLVEEDRIIVTIA